MLFNWLTAFWSITKEPEFCEIWVWCWSINNNISFQFRLFPEKTNDKIFQKIKKSPILGTFWALFAQLGQKWGLWILSVLVFQYSNYLPLCKKNQEKLMTHSQEKCWNDRRADKQAGNSHFKVPAIGQESKNILVLYVYGLIIEID